MPHPPRRTPARSGFTLVELSVVLVIVGLLAGGVLVGRDLIRAAELRAQVSQLTQLNIAVNSFEAKYDALPGDMTRDHAVAFGLPHWTAAWGTGNENGQFEHVFHRTVWGFPGVEHAYFAYHLSGAGLIPGHYRHCCSNGGADANTNRAAHEPGLDYPPMAANAQYGIIPFTSITFGGNWLILGAHGGTHYYLQDWVAPSLSPADAGHLDQKMDDGVPALGTVRAVTFVGSADYFDSIPVNATDPAGGCVADAAGAAYAAASPAIACVTAVRLQ